MDNSVMFNIQYGLYVLSAKADGKDNGCIINTFIQITSNPNRVLCGVNKANLTHNMIKETGIFNVSLIDTTADFELFKRFGFQSGRAADKFEDYGRVGRSANGLLYVSRCTNSYISCKVVSETDMGSHTLFTADVTDLVKLRDTETLTYNYYQNNIKPKKPSPPKEGEPRKKGWICKVCGYIYEGEDLPDDFVCPICKHGAQDFEKL